MLRLLMGFLGLAVVSYSDVAEAGSLRFTQQGRLLNATGSPLDGTHDLVVAVHTAATGGSVVWSKTFSATPFADGFFSVTLTGNDDTARPIEGALASASRFLSLSVGGQELGPRQPMAMVPEAGRAHGAAIVDATQPCDVLGGIGYDATLQTLHLCVIVSPATTGTWRRLVVSTGTAGGCPSGYMLNGSSCMLTTPRATSAYNTANADCRDEGATLCSSNELLLACEQRASLGLTFPQDEFYWLDHRNLEWWSTSGHAAAHHVFARRSTGCFQTSSVYSGTWSVNWGFGDQSYKYFCCRPPLP
jgi:hypothetical protein